MDSRLTEVKLSQIEEAVQIASDNSTPQFLRKTIFSLLFKTHNMSIEQMIARSYGHFLNHFIDPEKAAEIFLQYAVEELNLSGDAAIQYRRPILTDVEHEIASDKFDHFYTWYFINYMTNSEDSTLLN